MKFLSYSGETIALVLAQPNWRAHPKVTATLPTDVERAISGRQSRRNFARSSRYTLEYAARFKGAALATEFRIGVERLKTETVAVPLWTEAVRLGTTTSAGATSLPLSSDFPVRYGREWILLSADASAYEIVVVTSFGSSSLNLSTGTANNWPAGTLAYPLLFGRFSDLPKIHAITPQLAEADLKIVEDSTFARRLSVRAVTLPTVGGNVTEMSAMPLWTLEPNWSEPIDTTQADVLFTQIGFTRQTAKFAYPQFSRRGLEMEFVCRTRAQIAFVEAMFASRRGTTRPLMVPTFRNDLVVTQDLPISGSASLVTIAANEFSDASRPAQPGDPYVALVDGNGVDPQRITTISAGNLTLQGTITQAHSASTVRLSHLLLCCFAEAKIEWDYSTPNRATCHLKFVELPDEYATPNADLPEPVYLYSFTHNLPTPQISRFTSYEDNFTLDGNVYAPAPFAHGAIKQTLKFDQEKVEVTSSGGNFAANPLGLLIPFALEAELLLTIVEVDFNNPATRRTLFTGEVWELQTQGVDWKANCLAFGRTFERKFPRFLIQRTDNFMQFSAPTQLNRATFKQTSTISVLNASTGNPYVEVATLAQANDFFSFGWLETGSGANYERRQIVKSAALGGGGQRLYLQRPLAHAAVSQSIDVYPGYDGSLDECINKYANQANFGGHPFMPDTGPQIKAVDAKQVTGGKKG